jgi:hypothetical protein
MLVCVLKSGGAMKRPAAFLLLLFVPCTLAIAGTEKTQYQVKVSGGTTKADIGDRLELTLGADFVKAVDKSACSVKIDRSVGHGDCPIGAEEVVAAHFQSSAISEIVAGEAARFIGITWIEGGTEQTLVFEVDKKDQPSIVSLLEGSSGKRAVTADTQTLDRPRVFLLSESYGNQQNALRNQSMEMAADFKKVCPTVQITINQQRADFTIQLNHIEVGLINRDNQIEIYNKDGDLISGKEGGSIASQVKAACALITTQWAGRLR